MCSRRDLLVAAVSSALTITAIFGVQFHRSGPVTTLGRQKARREKAFVLSVDLTFADHGSAAMLLEAWSKAADWCMENEPFLFAYEIAQSDKNNLSYVIMERYRSKADYLGPHRRSPAFKAFRPKMRALQDSGGVVVTGNSYQEVGIGFT